jgi:hypothetical protein
MLRELKRWPLDYTILVGGVIVAMSAFSLVWPDTEKQNMIGMALGLFYTFWGIGHHLHTKTLTGKIAAEYAAFGLLVSLLIWLGLFY